MKLEIKNLTKTFATVKALDMINLCFDEPKIYGLLGRNGAGKTTLLNIITSHLCQDEGQVLYDGENAFDNDNALSNFHMTSEVNYYNTELKFKQAVKLVKVYYQEAFNANLALELASMFKLDINKKIDKLSTGYKSIYKCCIALALDVPYLFFDEPVLGLDANHRDLFYKLVIKSYQRKPKNIIISTHLIEEIAPLIEEFIIIKNGKILLQKSAEEFSTYASSITGPSAEVEAFVKGKTILGRNNIGALETVYIVGQPECDNKALTIQSLDVQKLFIQLTNDIEETRV